VDLASMWRGLRAEPAEMPAPGVHRAAAAGDLTIDVTQECLSSLPRMPGLKHNVCTVTVTSHRPGVAGQVTIGANFNSPDGSYQGPTTTVGQGEFTATTATVQARFVLLPAGWPVLGVGAEATWADNAPQSGALSYWQIACDPLVWWQWPIRAIAAVSQILSPR
jgi:hypothetical protein